MSTVVVVALLAGCTTYKGSRTVAQVGGYAMATGASVVAINLGYLVVRNEPYGPVEYYSVAIAALILASGVVLTASGGIGMAVNDKPPEPARALPQVDPECLRRRAGDLKRAQEIADRGQRTKALRAIPICEPVLVPATQVTP